jgi:hypothetical protein
LQHQTHQFYACAVFPHFGLLFTVHCFGGVVAGRFQDFVGAITGCAPHGKWFDFGSNAYQLQCKLYQRLPSKITMMKLYTPKTWSLRSGKAPHWSGVGGLLSTRLLGPFHERIAIFTTVVVPRTVAYSHFHCSLLLA